MVAQSATLTATGSSDALCGSHRPPPASLSLLKLALRFQGALELQALLDVAAHPGVQGQAGTFCGRAPLRLLAGRRSQCERVRLSHRESDTETVASEAACALRRANEEMPAPDEDFSLGSFPG